MIRHRRVLILIQRIFHPTLEFQRVTALVTLWDTIILNQTPLERNHKAKVLKMRSNLTPLSTARSPNRLQEVTKRRSKRVKHLPLLSTQAMNFSVSFKSRPIWWGRKGTIRRWKIIIRRVRMIRTSKTLKLIRCWNNSDK
jgi:hypothetical protein